MIESLERALLLVQQVFEDVRAGVADTPESALAELVLATQRVVNAASAVQSVALAGIAARDEVPGPDGSWVGVDRGVGHVNEFAAVTVAPMLGLTSRGAEDRVQTAAALVSRLPATLAAMAAGDLDGWRASIIVAETAETTAAGCARVEAVILPRVCFETGGRVRARTRRALALVDPDAVRARAAKARLERSVRVWPCPVVGLSEWAVVLPVHESALCKAAVDEHACALQREDPDLSMDQARADALVDLVLARVQVSTTVHLTMPVQTLTVDAPVDLPDVDQDGMVVGPSWQQICAMGYEIPGVGVVPGDVVAGICSRFDTRIRRVLLDETAGTTLETGAKGYVPPAAMGRFVRHRDGHCRAPGCARAARFCDLDHVTPWPLGPTDPTNLLTLCRRHHRMKHRTRWQVVMTRKGACTWTDPFGQEFITHPVNHHETLVA
jgi:Domain of unknown function (DUF222)